MSEQPVLDPPRPAEPEQDERRARRWPLLCGIVVVLAIGSTAALQFLGPEDALIAGACVAGAGVLGVVAWRLPQLRKHFGLGRGRAGRRWSFGLGRKASGGKRAGGAGFRLPKLGGRGGGTGKGRVKGLPKLGGRARAAGKSLAGRGKALGRALAGKTRGAGKSLSGAAKRLGRAVTGKGRSGAGKAGGGALRRVARAARASGGKLGKALHLPKLGFPGTGKAAAGMLRRAGRRLRHPFRGKPGSKGTVKSGSTGTGKSRKLPSIARGLRAIARGTRSAYRRARTDAGAQPGQSRWRKIGTAAAAVPFVPFIAAWAAWKKVRAWWRKRRQPPAQEPAVTPESVAEPQEPPERHPGPAMEPGSTTTSRRQPMSSAIDAVSEAFETHIGGLEFDSVSSLNNFLSDLPHLYDREASSLRMLADRLQGEYPIHADIAEVFRELAAKAAGNSDFAAELVSIFETRHEEDLNRLDNPRHNEQFMDYGNQ